MTKPRVCEAVQTRTARVQESGGRRVVRDTRVHQKWEITHF